MGSFLEVKLFVDKTQQLNNPSTGSSPEPNLALVKSSKSQFY